MDHYSPRTQRIKSLVDTRRGRSGLTNYVEFKDLPKLEQEMIEKHYLKEAVDPSMQFKSFDKFLQEALQLK